MKLRSLFFLLLVSSLCSLTAITKAYLGISFKELSPTQQKELNIDGYYGIVITKIEANSPAEKENLKIGDVLLEMNHEKIYTNDQMTKMMQSFKPNEKVDLKILCEGKQKKLSIQLGEIKDFSRKAYLGVFLSDLTEQDYVKNGKTHGVRIEKIIKDSPSEKAKLEKDDLLLELNGEKIYSSDQLSKMLYNYEPNTKVELTILRDGKQKDISVTLGEKDTSDWISWNNDSFDDSNLFFWKSATSKQIGVRVRELTDQSLQNYNLTHGIQVSYVQENSAAQKAGILANDILLSAEKQDIHTISDLVSVINDFEIGETVSITLYRNGKEKTLTCEIEEKEDLPFFDDFLDEAKMNKFYKQGKEIFNSDRMQRKLHDNLQKIQVFQEERIPELDQTLDELDEKIKEIKKIKVIVEEKSI